VSGKDGVNDVTDTPLAGKTGELSWQTGWMITQSYTAQTHQDSGAAAGCNNRLLALERPLSFWHDAEGTSRIPSSSIQTTWKMFFWTCVCTISHKHVNNKTNRI